MFWPFKRKPTVPWSEIVASKPDVECGNKEEHYRWEHIEGFKCPTCFVRQKKRDELEREERLATLIAIKVTAALRK